MNEEPKVDPQATLTVKVTRLLGYLESLDRKIAEIETEAKATADYFKHRVSQVENTKQFVTRQLEAIVGETKEKIVRTPKGSAFFTTRLVTQWPPDSDIITWVKEKGLNCVSPKDALNKNLLKAYIKETGDTPPGYATLPETKLSIRPVGAEKGGDE